jgi:hypothetical protein
MGEYLSVGHSWVAVVNYCHTLCCACCAPLLSALLTVSFLLAIARPGSIALEIVAVKLWLIIFVVTVIVFVRHALEGIVVHVLSHGIAQSAYTSAHFPQKDGNAAREQKKEESYYGKEGFHQ